MNPKYSIIIPGRNGGKYLKACIGTIINQDYDDYELIISNDHSTDGTKEFLSTLLSHPRVKVIEPSEELSMTEHWEWALSHATGTWQIFVGQDDGLQPYFFKIADKLTKLAQENKIRTIMSSRAYYFWPGCEPVYGDIAVGYVALDKIKIHNSFYEGAKALLGIQSYFELPEMYTTSLFHKSILEEARDKQNGKVLTCHPQDANLGAIAVSLENKYLKSFIPIGWVGSSPKSAGMAISSQANDFKKKDADTLKKLKKEYSNKINKSKLKYNDLAGDFSFGDNSLYFWQAFLETSDLRSETINKLLCSKLFKYPFFAALQVRLWAMQRKNNKQSQFKDILVKNKCSFMSVFLIGLIFLLVREVYKGVNFIYRVFRKIKNIISSPLVKVIFNRSQNKDLSIRDASEIDSRSMDKII